LKPGDLVRWKAEYIGDEDGDFYREKIGMIISRYEGDLDVKGLFNVLLDGMLVGGFDYELEVIDAGG
jgi:hypothetical protein